MKPSSVRPELKIDMAERPSHSVSPQSAQSVTAKPGTACLVCKRRKLKCSRDPDGCDNCRKADLPCVYPTPEPPGAVRKKRGPYKKDKPIRDRHLEDLVRYLEPRQAGDGSGSSSGSPVGEATVGSKSTGTGNQGTENLVTDALIALTKTSVAAPEEPLGGRRLDGGENRSRNAYTDVLPNASVSPSMSTSVHPPVEHIFDHWQIYMSRVDPLTKVIHCPSLGSKLSAAVRSLPTIRATAIETLIFAIYFCSTTACTPRETIERFGESQHTLLLRYGKAIEAALADNYGMPSLETIQALILYIVGCRRRELDANLRALFSLAVRMAQILRLDDNPKSTQYSPFDVEMRRRAWWQLCGLESRGAEEGGVRSTSIMEGRTVELPSNLNDVDLHPNATVVPVAREGVTEMTFVLLRSRIVQLVCMLRTIRQTYASTGTESAMKMKAEQNMLHNDQEHLFNAQFFHHLDVSRPYDWMCLEFAKGMLLKTRMTIDHPFSNVPTPDMPADERLGVLQSSVRIISGTQLLSTEKRIEQWLWFYRGYTQWHAVALVVAELGHSENLQFSQGAWAVLDPILQNWNKMYQNKRDEPAWDHVNTLIERARQKKAVQERAMRMRNVATLQPHVKVKENRSATPPSLNSLLLHDPTEQRTKWTDHNTLNEVRPAPFPSTITDPPPSDQIMFPQQVQQVLDPRTQLICVEPDYTAFDHDMAGEYDFDMLSSIDFDAFDAVFADEAWQDSDTFG